MKIDKNRIDKIYEKFLNCENNENFVKSLIEKALLFDDDLLKKYKYFTIFMGYKNEEIYFFTNKINEIIEKMESKNKELADKLNSK